MDNDIGKIISVVQFIGVLCAFLYLNMQNEILVVVRAASVYVGVSLVGSILAILVYKQFYSEE